MSTFRHKGRVVAGVLAGVVVLLAVGYACLPYYARQALIHLMQQCCDAWTKAALVIVGIEPDGQLQMQFLFHGGPPPHSRRGGAM